MAILRSILGIIFSVLSAIAAIRGVMLIVPVLTASESGWFGQPGLFHSGAIYLGISMGGMAIILAMLAYTCFRSRNSPSKKLPDLNPRSEA